MINLDNDKNRCICPKIKISNTPKECKDQYTISEQGKSITLKPKNNQEKVMVIVIDECIISDNNTKCDALYLYKKSNKKYSFLVELKGAGDIKKAFKQLSYTKYKRKEYKDILKKFCEIDNQTTKENFVIVSNGTMEKTRLEELEKTHNIRVKQIIHSEATTAIYDLKDYL
jgi:predicted nucleic acid-binding Zn finger protein